MAQSARLDKHLALSLLISASIVLGGCVTSPTKSFDQKAREAGFVKQWIDTGPFTLAVYANNTSSTGHLHVYIEGDGIPFLRERYVKPDPTSEDALVISLMRQDSQSSVLIGRPCYHSADEKNCAENKWWTSHRYSPTVVSSMAQAIEKIRPAGDMITLIGFSGGGSLAMLIGERLDNVAKIVTINANLDIHAWSAYHGYTPLTGSLNPIDSLNNLAHVSQTHLLGAKDSNVNASAWLDRLKRAQNIQTVVIPEFDHNCCWSDLWPELLEAHTQ